MSEAEVIRQLCAERGVSIHKLEKDLGFGNGYINPKKVTHLSHERLLRVAEYLGVSVGDITGEETQKPTPVAGSGSVEDQLLSLFNLLSESGKAQALSFVQFLSGSEQK